MKLREPRVAVGSRPGAWGLLIRKVSYAQIAISPRLSQAGTRHLWPPSLKLKVLKEDPEHSKLQIRLLGATQFEAQKLLK